MTNQLTKYCYLIDDDITLQIKNYLYIAQIITNSYRSACFLRIYLRTLEMTNIVILYHFVYTVFVTLTSSCPSRRK